jgi:hypothetical protein
MFKLKIKTLLIISIQKYQTSCNTDDSRRHSSAIYFCYVLFLIERSTNNAIF